MTAKRQRPAKMKAKKYMPTMNVGIDVIIPTLDTKFKLWKMVCDAIALFVHHSQ